MIAGLFTEAEGFAELGLWKDAWLALEELPADLRASPAALRVRLLCCPALEAWEIGNHVANLLRDGDNLDREAAARFLHEVAKDHVHHGRIEPARDAVAAGVNCWPEIRLAILDCPVIGPALF